jgi:hypothetical protein
MPDAESKFRMLDTLMNHLAIKDAA